MQEILHKLASYFAMAFVVLAIIALVLRVMWVMAGKPNLSGKDDSDL